MNRLLTASVVGVAVTACVAGGIATASHADVTTAPRKAAAQQAVSATPVVATGIAGTDLRRPPKEGLASSFLDFVIDGGTDALLGCLTAVATGDSCTDPDGTGAIKDQLDQMQKALEKGFKDVQSRLNRIEKQINDLHQEQYLSRLDPLRSKSAMALAAFANMTACAQKKMLAQDPAGVMCEPYVNGPLDESGVPESLGKARPADEAIAVTRKYFLQDVAEAVPTDIKADDISGTVELLTGGGANATKGYFYYAWQGLKMDQDEQIGTPQELRSSPNTPIVLPETARDFNAVIDFWDAAFDRWAAMKILAGGLSGTPKSQKALAEELQGWLVTKTPKSLPGTVGASRFPDIAKDELLLMLGEQGKASIINWSHVYLQPNGAYLGRELRVGDVEAIARVVNKYLPVGGKDNAEGGIEGLAVSVPGLLPPDNAFDTGVRVMDISYRTIFPAVTVNTRRLDNDPGSHICVSPVFAKNVKPEFNMTRYAPINPYNKDNLVKIWSERVTGPLDFTWAVERLPSAYMSGVEYIGWGAYIKCPTKTVAGASVPLDAARLRTVDIPRYMASAAVVLGKKPKPAS